MNEMEITYDAIVIGAGINGCGIAHEMCKRGHRVLVLDKGEIGGGTSSKSSRLIHGGLRYLETFRFGLVYEALHDRQELLETYPDLVSLQPFYLPIYQTSPRPVWKLWTGVKLYDLLAGRRNPKRSGKVPMGEFRDQFWPLKYEGIRAVLKYYDGKTNDWALTNRVAEETQGLGGRFLERTAVREVDWEAEGFRVCAGGETYGCQTLVNATGPWIDEVVAQLGLPTRYQVRKISGIHIFLKGLLTPEPMFLQASGKRIFFILPEPENNQTMIGTTEREEEDAIDAVRVREEDVVYLMDEVNRYLKPESQIQRADVKDAVIGIRPLVASRKDPTDLSREYRLDLHRKGDTQLLHVFGGKLTTYLSLARRVVRKLELWV